MFPLPFARSYSINFTVRVAVIGATLVGCALGGLCSTAQAAVVVGNLRCEYLHNPVGIDEIKPRFSWVLESSERSQKQTAYQILVASSREKLAGNQADLWDSGKVEADDTAQVAYNGRSLESRAQCFWKVRSWDKDGTPSSWSKPAFWTIGLLKPEDWTAKWIDAGPIKSEVRGTADPVIRRAVYEGIDQKGSLDVTKILTEKGSAGHFSLVVNNKAFGSDPAQGSPKRLHIEFDFAGRTHVKDFTEKEQFAFPEGLKPSAPIPYLRKAFTIAKPVRKATLYATALGLYEMNLNGKRVGDHVMAPDWTDYNKRVRYQAYDVTDMIKPGANVLGAQVANGWYSGHIGAGRFQRWGKSPALLAQLEVTGEDGSVQRIVTDRTWKCHAGPLLSSDIMKGESYDATQELAGWSEPGIVEDGWMAVNEREEVPHLLYGQVMEPVRQLMELHSKKITAPKSGCWIFDLGQNMVGVVRLKVSAPAGTALTLRHGEMLNPDGTLYTTNLTGAPSVDTYICKGKGVEEWQPKFTFHGFRYVELTGLSSKPVLEAVTGVVIGSDTPHAGDFSCSDARINQLQSNIQWGQRGNYLSVPTDCPQRNERLGWMGDASPCTSVLKLTLCFFGKRFF